MRNKIIIALFIVFCVPLYIHSRTIWRDINNYSAGSSINTGDIIIIEIDDISKIKFSINSAGDRSFNIVSVPDSNITPFLPRVSSNSSKKDNDKSSFSSTGAINFSIASRITEKLEDGKLRITGSRRYVFNGIINIFSVAGIVDPSLLKGRTARSNGIADFTLNIRGVTEKGAVLIERPQVKEGESSDTALTEQEKQTIILDYINKMLSEITK